MTHSTEALSAGEKMSRISLVAQVSPSEGQSDERFFRFLKFCPFGKKVPRIPEPPGCLANQRMVGKHFITYLRIDIVEV